VPNQTPVAKPSPSQQAPVVREPQVPVVKEMTELVNRGTSANLSIKKMMSSESKVVDSNATSYMDMPKTPFNFDELKMKWRQFAMQLKSEGKETFYNAMTKRNPIALSDTSFSMVLDNEVQRDMIKNDIDSLLEFLRKSLNNYEISVELKLSDNIETDVANMTEKDKFGVLAQKFPMLNMLKQSFDLDISY
jgi:DNA polymerase III subunit gamma/tau